MPWICSKAPLGLDQIPVSQAHQDLELCFDRFGVGSRMHRQVGPSGEPDGVHVGFAAGIGGQHDFLDIEPGPVEPVHEIAVRVCRPHCQHAARHRQLSANLHLPRL